MGFYYYNIFSFGLLALAYGVLTLVAVAIAFGTRHAPRRRIVWLVLAGAVLLAPIGEELWIAWNFGRACKDAGTFIYKKVQADGFYDDSGGGGMDLLRAGTYRFIESKGERGVTRLTLGDADLLREAFARFQAEQPWRDPSKEELIRVSLSDKTEALVFPRRKESWRIVRLERPSARYHFRSPHVHTPVSHKVKKFESVVIDTESKEELARETTFSRDASWFYIGLERASLFCPVHGNHGEKRVATLYTAVLESQKRN